VKRVEQVHLESWSGKREVWIRCMVDAEPQAEVTWLLDGKVWDSYRHPSSVEVGGHNFTLQMEGPPVTGEFSCTATNSVGVDTKSTIVTDDKCPVLIASLLTTLFKMKSGTKEDLTVKAELCMVSSFSHDRQPDGEIQEVPDVKVNITAHIDTFIDGWPKSTLHDTIIEEEKYHHDTPVSSKNLLREDNDYSDNDGASSMDYDSEDDLEYYSDEYNDENYIGSGEYPDETQVFFADEAASGEKNPKMQIFHAKEEFYQKDIENKNVVTFAPEEVMLTDEPETKPKNYLVKERYTISENQKTLRNGSSQRKQEEDINDTTIDEEDKSTLEVQDSKRENLVDAGLSWLLLCIAFVSIMILFIWACFRDTLKKTSYDY